MKITRTNPFTRISKTKEINITQEEINKIDKGFLIQDVAPHLSANDREFIISGIEGEEFDDLFKEENVTLYNKIENIIIKGIIEDLTAGEITREILKIIKK